MSSNLFAQFENSYRGTEFWIGCMDNEENQLTPLSEDIRVFISAEQYTIGKLSVPGQSYSVPFSVQPDSTVIISVPNLIAEHRTNETIEDKAILIQSNQEVTVSVSSYQDKSSDATAILPTDGLGFEYLIGSYRGPVNGFSSEFLIVATGDNTKIDITPSTNTFSGKPAFLTFSVVLNKGESYQVKGENLADLTGSLVSVNMNNGSCHPIAVFSGVECARIPTNCTFCDHLYEQNIPTRYWGTRFIMTPFSGIGDYVFRVLGKEDNTTLTLNGGATSNLNRGQFVELSGFSFASCLEADKPIQVIQYMKGNSCSSAMGDPSMLFLSPLNHRFDRVVFRVANQTYVTSHFLDIIVHVSGIASVKLDGQLLNPASFVPVSFCNDYATLSIPVTSGIHKLESSAGMLANLYGYGIGSANPESYALSLGGHLQDSESYVSQTCSSGPLQLSGSALLKNTWWMDEAFPSDTLVAGDTLTLSAPVRSGIYTRTGINSISGCTLKERHLVESSAPLSLTLTSAKDTICRNEMIQLTANLSSDSGTHTYHWFSGGLDETENIPYKSFRPSSSGWVYCEVSTPGGCVRVTDSIYIYVKDSKILESHTFADKTEYCSGDTARLGVEILKTIFSDQAESGVGNWSSAVGVVSGNLVGSVNGNAFVFIGSTQRYLRTPGFNLTNGGRIQFFINVRENPALADMPENHEVVELQYTTNNGSTWNTFQVYYPYAYDGFTRISIDLPALLRQSNIAFRWIQPIFSGGGLDAWALDDISVAVYDTTGFTFNWLPAGIMNSPTVAFPEATPDSSVLVQLELTDQTYSCQVVDTLHLKVGKHFSIAATNDTLMCDARGIQLHATPVESGNYRYFWQPFALVSDPFAASTHTFNRQSTTFLVDVASEQGCHEKDTIQVDVNFLTNLLITVDDSTICIGDTVRFNTTISETFLNDDFDPIENSLYWAEISGGVISSLCGSVSGNALYFNGGTNRFAETVDLNTANGGTISFKLIRGSGAAPCESVDGNDPIHCEYSTDGGATWVDVFDSIISGYTFFTTVTVAIPAAAQTPATRFRWRQSHWDGKEWDHWALEDVVIISVSNPDDYSFLWSPSATLSSDTVKNPLAFPLSQTEYTLQLTDSTGCVVTRQQQVYTGSHFSLVLPPDTTICSVEGLPVSATISISSIESYLWSPGNRMNDSTIKSPVLYPFDTVQYTVAVTSDFGCTERDTMVVYVPKPVILNILATDTSLCIGNQTLLTASVVYEIVDSFNMEIDKTQWSKINGATASSICGSVSGNGLHFSGESIRSAETKNINTIAGGTITFQLKYANDTLIGCEDVDAGEMVVVEYSLDGGNTWGMVASVPVNNTGVFGTYSYSIPQAARTASARFRWRQVSFNSGGNDNWVLENVRITSGSNSQQFAYSWESIPATLMTDSAEASVLVQPLQRLWYKVSLYDTSSGCSLQDSIEIRAGVDFNTFTSPDTSKCFASPMVLSVGNNYSGTVYPVWSPAEFVDNPNAFSPVFTPDTTMDFIVESISDSGCIKRDTIHVIVMPELYANISATDTGLCFGDSTEIVSTPTGGIGVLYSSWSPTLGLSDSVQLQVVAKPLVGTTYYLQLEDSVSGCTITDSIRIWVGNDFNVFVSNDTIVCEQSIVTLTANHDYPGGMRYFWSPDSLISKVNAAITFAYVPDTVHFTVKLTSDSGCSKVDTVHTFFPDHFDVGITDLGGTHVCEGGDIFLIADEKENSCDQYLVDTVPFGIIPGPGTPILLGNESVSFALPIGFDFKFYCNYYNQFYISSNGFITFSDGQFHGCCAGKPIPDAAGPNNYIAYAWANLDPLNGGSMNYFTVGTAPDRILVVNIRDIEHGSGSGDSVNLQLQLYESSNDIIIQTRKMESDGSFHTMGIENATGTDGLAYPGRNAMDWSAYEEGVRFRLNYTSGSMEYEWFPKEFITIDSTKKTLVNPFGSQYITVAGTDTISGCTFYDSIFVETDSLFSVQTIQDTVLCSTYLFNLPTTSSLPGVTYQWEPAEHLNGSQTNIPTINKGITNIYTVTATDPVTGCKARDKVLVVDQPEEALITSPDTLICKGQSVPLFVTGGSNYSWGPANVLINGNSNSPTAFPTKTTTFVVNSTDSIGCTASALVIVRVDSVIPLSLGNDVSICYDVPFTFDAGTGFNSYLWQDGSTGQTFDADTVGTYYVTASNACIILSDTVRVTSLIEADSFSLGNDTAHCGNEPLQIGVSLPMVSYRWNSGDTSGFIFANSGEYILWVENIFGCVSVDTIYVVNYGFPSNPMAPVEICRGDSVFITVGGGVTYNWTPTTNILGYQTNTPVIIPMNSMYYFVHVTDSKQCEHTDSILIRVDSLPSFFLEDTFTVCAEDDVWLIPNQNFKSYLWSTGAEVKKILADSPGSYVLRAEGNCGFGSDTAVVALFKSVPPLLDTVNYICDEDSIEIRLQNHGDFESIKWSRNASTLLTDTNLIWLERGSYLVQGTDSNGCRLSTSFRIESGFGSVTVPNIVTPNGDNQNDVFKLTSYDCIEDFEIIIFNRWGKKVFESDAVDFEWDDPEVADGTYYYQIILTNSFENNSEIKGWIQVVK